MEIHSDFWHPIARYGDTGSSIQLDIFIPRFFVHFFFLIKSLNLAFEYQGVQHFEKSNVMNDVSTIQSKDEDKLVQASKEGIFVYVTLTHTIGITIILIPYWWDHTINSLKATIHKSRPDLFPELKHRRISPIPDKPSKRMRKIGKMSKLVLIAENEEIFLKPIPPHQKSSYFLSTGSTRGLVPKCTGCRRSFDDRVV